MKTHIGMSDEDVLRSATSYAAEAIGWAEHLGRIEPGYLADFVLLRSKPWKDVTKNHNAYIVAVVSHGRVVHGTLPSS